MSNTILILKEILKELRDWPVSEYHNQHFSPHYLLGLTNAELIILRKLELIQAEDKPLPPQSPLPMSDTQQNHIPQTSS
jgi:hypothetical protein